MSCPTPGAPAPPAVARDVFGDRLSLAIRYAEWLAGAGAQRGLLGPREAPRLWERHLLNSAYLADLVEPAERVVDVGSGAGLPGIPLALARPDLTLVLLEPLLRRSTFLQEVVDDLCLENVTVLRGRAPEDVARLPFLADSVVARAVAPLERLVSWTMPLCHPSGRLLAIRGESAAREVQDAAPILARAGVAALQLRECGAGRVDPPVLVVEARRVGGGAEAARRGSRRDQARHRSRSPGTFGVAG